MNMETRPKKGSSFPRIALLGASIVGISLLHYLTPLHLHYLHDIFQRFYYIPIILAALWHGFRGGLGCALAVSVVYAPHILFQWGEGFTLGMEKYLEIVMYNVVGALTGLLAQRERERSRELERTAAGLGESNRRLQSQSEHIIAVEEQLRRAERLSTLGEMAAVLAHEIRNPLGSIRGTAEILRDDFQPGTPKHEFIEIQIRETERLNRVVEDFLRLTRPRATAMQSCSLRQELETIVTLTTGDASRRGILLTLQPPDDELTVTADGEKLRQAFLNIIINALQATPQGGSVTVSAHRTDGGCEVLFSDTGQGIPDDLRERIFEPFFTTKPDGTGLGLAITKKIIESHGGSLTVESPATGGTIVTVKFLKENTP